MAADLITADSSVVIPALSLWHPVHDRARHAIRDVQRLPAHVLLETFSVLTRLPGRLALSPAGALELIASRFDRLPLSLSPQQEWALLESAAGGGLTGGQVYDALVGATAAARSAVLVSRDARARRTYQVVGVEVSWLLDRARAEA